MMTSATKFQKNLNHFFFLSFLGSHNSPFFFLKPSTNSDPLICLYPHKGIIIQFFFLNSSKLILNLWLLFVCLSLQWLFLFYFIFVFSCSLIPFFLFSFLFFFFLLGLCCCRQKSCVQHSHIMVLFFFYIYLIIRFGKVLYEHRFLSARHYPWLQEYFISQKGERRRARRKGLLSCWFFFFTIWRFMVQ